MTMARREPPRRKEVPETTFRSVVRTLGLLRRVMDPYFTQMGISGSQWGVLRALQRAEDEGAGGLRVTDLSSRLLVQPPSTTGVVDRLQRMGLVERKASRVDHRAKRVKPDTKAGRKLVEQGCKGIAGGSWPSWSGLNVQEQEQMYCLMDKLAKAPGADGGAVGAARHANRKQISDTGWMCKRVRFISRIEAGFL